jgi:Zn-dependent membrane protease YugP
MNGAVLALMIAGLVGFGAGAYLAATGSREVGIILMGGGLLFQVLTLRKLRAAKEQGK